MNWRIELRYIEVAASRNYLRLRAEAYEIFHRTTQVASMRAVTQNLPGWMKQSLPPSEVETREQAGGETTIRNQGDPAGSHSIHIVACAERVEIRRDQGVRGQEVPNDNNDTND